MADDILDVADDMHTVLVELAARLSAEGGNEEELRRIADLIQTYEELRAAVE